MLLKDLQIYVLKSEDFHWSKIKIIYTHKVDL